MANFFAEQDEDVTSIAKQFKAPCTVAVFGTFDGAAVKILAAIDSDDTFVEVEQLVGAAIINIGLAGSYWLKAQLVGSGASTSVTVRSN